MLLQDFRKLLERAGQCSPPRAGYNNYGSGRERGPDRRSPLTNNVSLHGDPSRARNSTSKAVPRPGVGADAARAAARHRGCRGCRGPNVRLLSRGGKGALLRRATGSPVVVLCAAPRPAQFLPSRTGRVRAGRVRAQIQRPKILRRIGGRSQGSGMSKHPTGANGQSAIEEHLDGWQRFERAVDAAVKSAPRPSKPAVKSPQRKRAAEPPVFEGPRWFPAKTAAGLAERAEGVSVLQPSIETGQQLSS